jgi:transcriptional regulator with XRE-family HTH domain
MTWSEIHAHYLRLFKMSGKSQEQIARAGGIKQNSISKLIANRKRGPTVATFVAAVRGLGISLSTFFAQLERFDGQLPTDGETPPGIGRGADDETDRQWRQFLRGVRAAIKAFDDETRDRPMLRRRPRRRKN